MPQDLPLGEQHYVNLINGSTGAYLEEPFTPQQVGDAAQSLVEDQARDTVLTAKSLRVTQPSYRPLVGVDERELGQTGWGVIFPRGAPTGLKKALQPLLGHRQEDAGDFFKVYDGEDGYLPGDTGESFRLRHKVSNG